MNSKCHSVYQIVNETTGEIVYVGITSRSVSARFAEHTETANRLALFPKRDLIFAWHGPENLSYHIVDQYEHRQDALIHEHGLIAELTPTGNIYGTDRSRRSN